MDSMWKPCADRCLLSLARRSGDGSCRETLKPAICIMIHAATEPRTRPFHPIFSPTRTSPSLCTESSLALSPLFPMPPAPEDVRNGRKAKLSSNDGGPLEAAHRFWQTSYAGDYLGLAVVATLLLLIRLLSEPFPQTFILSDTRIQHPWTEVERVSTGMFMISPLT